VNVTPLVFLVSTLNNVLYPNQISRYTHIILCDEISQIKARRHTISTSKHEWWMFPATLQCAGFSY